MRNTVSTCLLGIGVFLFAAGFITGIVAAQEGDGGFRFIVALYWWLSAIIAGFFFIGLSEIVHLLQRILDKSAAPSSASAESLKREGEISSETTVTNGTASSREKTAVSSNASEAQPPSEVSEGKIKDLTLVLDGERFKGQLWITASEVQVVKRSAFQSESEAQIVKVINKSDLSSDYERNKDYFVYSFKEGSRIQKLEFKTHNLYDYERIVNLLK